MFWDRVSEVSKGTIIVYSRTDDLDTIQSKLYDWERAGYLQILKPIKNCERMEPCIRLLSRIPLD